VTLHKPADGGAWRAFARPARRLRIGDRIRLGDGFEAEVRAKYSEGDVMLSFHGMALEDGLARFGTMPLPPYITRAGDAADRDDYQTVYATVPGAVAAPTAGLHFTDELLSRLEANRVGLVRLTLHVGAGTFLPVRATHIEQHTMHAERGVLSADAAEAVNRAHAAGGRVVAVGSTSLRLLESAAGPDGQVRPFAGETDIFITPGYRFRVADLLLTNFHLPRSTLFMLVAAFAGLDRMRSAYEHAKRRGYRFYSYGDATLLQRGDAE
jgi:S-adenosylmethionine:tRNA ribosyltransferase-isomerase